MADVTDRIKKRKEKEKEKENATGNPSPMPGTKEPEQPKEQPLPASGDVNTPDAMPAAPAPQQPTAPSQESRMVSAAPNAMAQPGTSLTNLAKVDTSIDYDRTPEWAKMSYEDLVKIQPNVSRGQYAYALSNHRRQTGQPDLSYAEWQNIIKGNNPWETEKEKKTRERREKAAFLIDGIGGLLGNLVNYVRAKNGHVAMQGFDVGKAYDRYRQLQQGQQKLAQNNYQSYMDAIVRERAERAKNEAAAASRAQAEQKAQQDYEYRMGQLQIQMMNAKTAADKARLEAEARRVKAEHDRKYDALRHSETVRHNKEMEGRSSNRVATSASTAKGKIMTRSTPLSMQEAKMIVERYYDGESPVEDLYAMKGNNGKKNGKVDWMSAAEDILADQIVDSSFLESLGYEMSGDDLGQTKTVAGYGGGQSASKRIAGYGQ